jgi:hypothetical protein
MNSQRPSYYSYNEHKRENLLSTTKAGTGENLLSTTKVGGTGENLSEQSSLRVDQPQQGFFNSLAGSRTEHVVTLPSKTEATELLTLTPPPPLANSEPTAAESFKQSIKQWITEDNEIREMQHALALRKIQHKNRTETIMDLMNKNQSDCITTQTEYLKYRKNVVKKPLTNKVLNEMLAQCCDPTKADEIYQFLLENRQTTVKEKIVRVSKKQKPKIDSVVTDK